MPGWTDVNTLNDDQLAERILTGCGGIKGFLPDIYVVECVVKWLVLAENRKNLSILDFGAGMGRNALAFAKYGLNVTAYDSIVMLNRASRYLATHGKGSRVSLRANWTELCSQPFDCIFASLVFQHIPEPELREYLSLMRAIAPILVVYGRRFNDDARKNTWSIVLDYYEIAHDPTGNFSLDGNPDDHALLFLTPRTHDEETTPRPAA